MKKSFLAVLLAAMVIVSVLSSCATSTQKSPAETIPESIGEPVRAEEEPVRAEEEQPVIPTVHPEEEAAVIEIPSAKELHEYEIMGVGIDAYVSSDHAEIMYPADMVDQKTVSDFLAYAIESYGYMLEGLSYEVTDGEVVFRYPAQWGYAERGLVERILADSAPLFFGQTAVPAGEEPGHFIVDITEDQIVLTPEQETEIVEDQIVLTPEQKAEAGIEIVGTSTGEIGTYSMEDIIAMYQPEGENPETSAAPAYLPAEDDLSGFEFLETQTVDLSEFTWIADVKDGSAAEKIQQSVSEISAAAEADRQTETAAPASAEKQTVHDATEDPKGVPAKDSKGVSVSLVVWIVVGIGLIALGIVTLLLNKKRK